MNFIYLMDPLSTVNVEKDTTFVFMLEAHRRGYNVFYLSKDGITRVNGQTLFHVIQVQPQRNKEQPFIELERTVLNETNVDAVFIRTDPPFNEEYLMHTWLLELLPQHIPVINKPSGIRSANEKIWATQFTDLVPNTLIGRNLNDLIDFIQHEKKVVSKPTDGYGGQGINILTADTTDLENLLKQYTENFTKDIILQQFIPESDQGDKRIILLNGDPLGAVLRVHAEGEFRNNFFAGGQAVKAEITEHEHKICQTLKPYLQQLGLYFVGIDVMGDYLVEVNVTSPTCVQEINTLNNVCLEAQVIDFVEKLVDQNKSVDKINTN